MIQTKKTKRILFFPLTLIIFYGGLNSFSSLEAGVADTVAKTGKTWFDDAIKILSKEKKTNPWEVLETTPDKTKTSVTKAQDFLKRTEKLQTPAAEINPVYPPIPRIKIPKSLNRIQKHSNNDESSQDSDFQYYTNEDGGINIHTRSGEFVGCIFKSASGGFDVYDRNGMFVKHVDGK